MRIVDVLKRAKGELAASGTPQLDAEVLLAHVLGKTREFLIARPEYLLSSAEQKKIGIALQQRKRGIPVAHILGKSEFYGLEFIVTHDVLVPRPETELIVEAAIKLLQKGGTLLDIGTGSGCIPIAVAKHVSADIYATDISEAALTVAQQNAKKHRVDIHFKQIDLLNGIDFTSLTKNPIMITANLPYVPSPMRHISTTYEPTEAIESGADGLDHYRRFFQELTQVRFDYCLFEYHPPQKEELESITANLFPDAKIEFHQDHAGLWRYGNLTRNDVTSNHAND